MQANERQVGGDHYKGTDYQYWDFAEEAKLGYLAGCAGKYVYRHKRKAGAQDLEKAIHFIDKCEEMHVPGALNPHWRELLEALTGVDLIAELEAIFYICIGNWPRARTCAEALLSESLRTVVQ